MTREPGRATPRHAHGDLTSLAPHTGDAVWIPESGRSPGKESQASCGVWREDSVLLSMPGRKQVPHLVMTGAYRGFSRAAAPVGVFSRGTTRISFKYGSSNGKESACYARNLGWIPGSGRSPNPGGGHGNPLQYSCLENRMDRGTWWITVHGVAQSRAGLRSHLLHSAANIFLPWQVP